jgi:hypothetical protein
MIRGGSSALCVLVADSIKQRFGQRQREHGVAGRNDIVHHYAQAVFNAQIKKPRGLGFGDVVKAKQRESGHLPPKTGRRQEQDEPERHDFIPHNGAVVRHAEIASGDLTGAHAQNARQ